MQVTTFTRGQKRYELADHLGNVLATISDKRIARDDGGDGGAGTPNDGMADAWLPDLVTAQEYYVFGGVIADRSYSQGGEKYRYGFNGKENMDNVSGAGNFQDYGMRSYDPRIGRFVSVDPITSKYPELTPYQFASNTPIQAIDLDGLEAFFIHGTTSDHTRWNESPAATLAVKTILKITNNKSYNIGFDWKAPIYNGEKMRLKGAEQLADYVSRHRIEGEEITLIGHSHGGNVAIQAAKLIHERTGEKVNIVTIGTPAYNKTGDAENPESHKEAIRDHIAIWNKLDGVSGGLAGEDYYTNSSITTNVEIDVSSKYGAKMQRHKTGRGEVVNRHADKFGAHSFDVNHPDLIKKAIDSGSLRKLKIANKKKAE